MRTLAYSEIERMVATGMGWDAANLSGDERDSIRQALNESLKWTWEWEWWPDVMETRHLALRDDWSLQNIAVYGPYAVGDQVYFADAGQYYMAIADVQGEPPASWNAATETWDETPTRWKEIAASYEATTWEPGVTYADTDFTVNSVFSHDGRTWLPLLEWFELPDNAGFSPTSDPQYWLELPALDNVLPIVGRNRPMIGEMRAVTELDARTTQDPRPYTWDQTTDGVLVYDFIGPRLWAEYRRACPNFIGELWSATATYSAAPEYENLYGEAEEPDTEPTPIMTEAPVITPNGGSFTGSQLVTITCATAGATIRYTINGTTPTSTSGTVYSGQFPLAASATVKAIAYASGLIDSSVTSATFSLAYAIFYGTSTATTLDGAGIAALESSVNRTTPAGTYVFAAPGTPEKYLYFAWPHALAAEPTAGTGFETGGLSMEGDFAGAGQGYAETSNGWPFALVSVSGTDYRVFRTLYQQALGFTVTVTT